MLLAAILLPACAAAQSDDNSVPLGDVARALRKDKEKEKENKSEPATGTVIDNDNLSKVMDQAESQRLKGGARISFSSGGNEVACFLARRDLQSFLQCAVGRVALGSLYAAGSPAQ